MVDVSLVIVQLDGVGDGFGRIDAVITVEFLISLAIQILEQRTRCERLLL